jgi:FdhE protein
MTLDDWLRSHPYLERLADVRRRIDAAVDAAVTPIAVPPDWDEYAEDFTAGVPLLRSQAPLDLEPAGQAVVAVFHHLAAQGPHAPLAEDAAELSAQFRQDDEAARHVVDWLLGDDRWDPVQPGLLRSVGWITASAALAPLVQAFGGWRDEDRWLRRYCPTCGALPAMAQLVGVDPGRRRFLICGRCASQWRYGRTNCPLCEGESHRLASVGVEGEGGLRIDYCEACRGYLKTYNGQGHERVLLADWTSLHLDLVARERGLKRLAASLYDLPSDFASAPPGFSAASGETEYSAGGRPAFVE